MIQANELRLGNYLLFYGEPAPIKAGAINAFDRHLIDVIRHIQPIPLTPEILEKCGFKKMEYGYVLNDNYWYLSFKYQFNIAEFRITKPIEYVHQLQNVIYSLTGEELTINLP